MLNEQELYALSIDELTQIKYQIVGEIQERQKISRHIDKLIKIKKEDEKNAD